MGLIDRLFGLVFGSGNVVRETAEVFRENAEKSAQRGADLREAAMAQFGAEFTVARQGRFDRLVDGLNRLPRPALAFGTLGLFVAAMIDPIWFASRMTGIALVPEPLWWLLGAIVSFYFGARHQVKGHAFQRSIAATLAQVPAVIETQAKLAKLSDRTPGSAATGSDASVALSALSPTHNAALEHWRIQRRAP
ncbi:holin family protein [Cognatishimia sp. MH4019]|uniref:holin family protein n=1 Tax=Cognatishimia sp. MH4019 TaxID=2854030 RepID=UPI001CD3F00A|nr:holin family protein [Cognatishimia sp. MH4019]